MEVIAAYAEIAIIPAIESFHLENAGIVMHASMTFPGKFTFVFRQRPAEGETTLISGLCAAAGLPLTRGLPPVLNGKTMSIGAKWKRPLRHQGNVDFTPTDPAERPMAEVALSAVSDVLSRTGGELCVVLGSDTFTHMDHRHLPEVVRLVNSASCQVIVFVYPERAAFLLDAIKPSAVYEFIELPDQPELFRVQTSPIGNP